MMFEFVESRAYSIKLVEAYSEAANQKLRQHLVKNPREGTPLPGTCGIRVLRHELPGISGLDGAWIYYFHPEGSRRFYLLLCLLEEHLLAMDPEKEKKFLTLTSALDGHLPSPRQWRELENGDALIEAMGDAVTHVVGQNKLRTYQC